MTGRRSGCRCWILIGSWKEFCGCLFLLTGTSSKRSSSLLLAVGCTAVTPCLLVTLFTIHDKKLRNVRLDTNGLQVCSNETRTLFFLSVCMFVLRGRGGGSNNFLEDTASKDPKETNFIKATYQSLSRRVCWLYIGTQCSVFIDYY